MAITTTNITGVIALPDGTIPSKSSVTFTMTGFDTDATAGVTIAPRKPQTAQIQTDGTIDINLWPNDDGTRSTLYNVELEIYNGKSPYLVPLGQIEVPQTAGPHDLTDLLPVQPPADTPLEEYLAQLQAAISSTEAAQSAAASSASDAAASASDAAASASEAAASAFEATGRDLRDVEAVQADGSLTYATGQVGTVVEGDIVRTRKDGRAFAVAASGAVDHHYATAGGVKLYDLTPLHLAGDLRQRADYEPFAGFDDGTTDDQIFTGSRLPAQGVCRLTVSGVDYDFVALRDDSGGSSPERYRIVQYQVGTPAPVTFSGILNLGHVQDLSGSVSGTNVTLYCQMDGGKGISVVAWDGATTTQADVTTYQMFGSDGSGHRYARYKDATVGVSGDKVLLLANDSKSEVDDTGHYLFVYSLAEVLAAADPLDVEPKVGPTPIAVGREEGQNTLQGCDPHDDHFRLLRGFVNPRQRKCLQFWDYRGNLLRTVEVPVGLNDYTQSQLGAHGTLETLITIEPEGVTSDNLGRAIFIAQEEWRATGDVVSWEGKNFTPRRSSVTSSPSVSDDWVETTATASGPWSAGTYTWGGNYTRRAKTLHILDKPLASGADTPTGNAAWFVPSLAPLKSTNSVVDAVAALGNDFLVGAVAGAVGKIRRLFGHYSEFSMRLFDARDGSNNDSYSSLATDRSTGREVFELRATGSIATGAGINMYGIDDTDMPGRFRLWTTKSNGTPLEVLSHDPVGDYWTALRGIPQVIAASGARVAHTGSTSETTLATVTVPGGILGPNGFLRIRVQTGQTNNSNNKTLKIKMGGSNIVDTTGSVTGSSGTSRIVQVHNRNSEGSQVTQGANAHSDPSETGVAVTTLSVDTSADFDLVFTAILSNAADELALEAYSVEAVYVP